MANTKINSIKVDGDHLEIDVTIENTSYRGEKVTVNFKGTGSLKDVVSGFVGQQKIAHSGKIEQRAFDELKARGELGDSKTLSDCSKAERAKVQARVQEIARNEIQGETVNPFNLDVTPQDLAELLEQVPAPFHQQVRSMYETHGLEWAEKLVETITS